LGAADFSPTSPGFAMLTGKLVRVRFARDRIVPHYLDAADPGWLETAERLLELFRGQEGRTRGELEADLDEAFGDDPSQLVPQGLAKLLEDRCEFEVVSGHPPAELRDAVFRAAAKQRQEDVSAENPRPPFDREAVLAEVAGGLELTPAEVDRGLFADLKSEQRLVKFKDLSAERLLQRYNVALAQAVLLRSIRVLVTVRNEPPQRYRQLLRYVKFHRLTCEMEKVGPDSYRLALDGPLSLFAATQKYGLQLALFLPAVLLCRDFELKADLRWGPQRRPKTFQITSRDGLVSHLTDAGSYVPAELGMFVELFRKRVAAWDIIEETEIYPLGSGFWVPDFQLVHKETGLIVRLEVLGFWRRASAERHLERLRQHVREPFLLAVSDALRVDEAELEGLPAEIHRFRQMPLPDEIARLADRIAAAQS
jgi:predicted nuclease of restriction endonuclease-like RecB superfamily